MQYAITGDKGLIGTHLKKRLDKEGHKCVLHIDQREGFNVMDLMFKETELNDKIDVFFHFAAQCRINEAIAKPILPHKNNTDGIFAVLEFCRVHKIPKIVVASTSRVLSPDRNPYVASKVYVEELTKAYHDCYGLKYIIIRPSTVYGPMFDETSRLFNNWITSAFKGEDLRLYGNNNKTLDLTYIDDFVDGVMLTIDHAWNKEYNISGEKSINLCSMALKIIKQVGSKSKLKYFAKETSQPQQVRIDTSEIKAIGYDPKIGIDEGIEIMTEFYKEHPKAWKDYKDKGKEFYK